LKRHTTSERPRYSHDDDDDVECIDSNDNAGWTSVTNNRQRRKLNDRDDRFSINSTRIFTDSTQHHKREQQTIFLKNDIYHRFVSAIDCFSLIFIILSIVHRA
jgi:hypothetical protein